MKKDKSDPTVSWQACFAYQQACMAQCMDGVQQMMHLQQQALEDLNPSSQRKRVWNGSPWIQENAHCWTNAIQNNLNGSFQQFFAWHRYASNYAKLFEVYAQIKNKPKVQ